MLPFLLILFVVSALNSTELHLLLNKANAENAALEHRARVLQDKAEKADNDFSCLHKHWMIQSNLNDRGLTVFEHIISLSDRLRRSEQQKMEFIHDSIHGIADSEEYKERVRSATKSALQFIKDLDGDLKESDRKLVSCNEELQRLRQRVRSSNVAKTELITLQNEEISELRFEIETMRQNAPNPVATKDKATQYKATPISVATPGTQRARVRFTGFVPREELEHRNREIAKLRKENALQNELLTKLKCRIDESSK